MCVSDYYKKYLKYMKIRFFSDKEISCLCGCLNSWWLSYADIMAGGESLQHYITTLFVWREAFLLVFSLNNKELTEELFDANHREQLSFNVTSRHAQVSKNTTFRSVSEHRQGGKKAVFPSIGRQMRGGSTVKLPASVASTGRGPDTNSAAGKLRKTLKKPRHKHLPATGRESV